MQGFNTFGRECRVTLYFWKWSQSGGNVGSTHSSPWKPFYFLLVGIQIIMFSLLEDFVELKIAIT